MTTFDLSHEAREQQLGDFTGISPNLKVTLISPSSDLPIVFTQPLKLPMRLIRMNTHTPLISSRVSNRCFEQHATKRAFATALLLSLTLGLVACSPAETTAGSSDQNTAETGEVATEAVEEGTAKTQAAAKIYVEDGVAIGGADPVAYFSSANEGEFVEGRAEYSYKWRGATWQFVSAENRDAFATDPEQYAPQYGGHCAWAVAQDAIAAIDPSAWKVVDGKLYLNLNQKIQTRWEKDVPGNIAKADTNWPKLAAQ